jgi:predicted HAD superfamily hydrolase
MTRDPSWTTRDAEQAGRLHAALEQARRGLGLEFAERDLARRACAFAELWAQTLPRIGALSVDVFDTALVRTCVDPDDVFLFLKEEPPFAELPQSAEQIGAWRDQAEREARTALRQQHGSVEVTLEEIYARFCNLAGLPDAHSRAFAAAEEAVELAIARAHPQLRELIRQAETNGKRLLFVSDTYHSREFLHRLLTTVGYTGQPESIFASCEFRVGKSNGALLLEACRALGLKPDEVAHLGDNPDSDQTGAYAAGMTALLHPFAVSVRHANRHHALGTRRIESLVRGAGLVTAGEAHEHPFWFRLGAETFGPLLTSFVRWLIAEWRRDGIEHAFFLLRDGFILRQIYEEFRAVDPSLPTSAFLCSSRRAFAVPALGCEQTRSIDALLVSGNPRPAREFLERLELDPAPLADAFRASGFSSPDEVVDHRGSATRIVRLFRHPDVVGALGRHALLERKLLVRYLAQEGVTEARQTALVDVGWNNTIQKSLLAVLDHEKIAHQLRGYYLGTLSDAQDFHLRDYHYAGYLCRDGEPRALGEPIAACRFLLEVMCTNFEGSLRTFTKGAGKIEPVFDPVDMTPGQAELIRAVHDGILRHAREIARHPLRDRLGEIPSDIASDNLIRLLTRPTPEEAALIGALEHGDGAGSQSRKPLAAFGHGSLAPDDLFASYRNAYWKQGLLALDTAQAMALRQLVAPLI